MTGTHIHSDVDYYDQLGVARNATTEDIRHAYRSLVRLLHPDQQTDPDLKAAAEKQLRKLNRIHAVLVDKDQRLAYDEYLADDWAPPVFDDSPNLQLRKNLIRAGWIAGSIVTVVLVFWLGSETGPADPLPAVASIPKPALPKVPVPQEEKRSSAGSSGDAATLKVELDRALSERDDALRELAKLRQPRKGLLPRLLALPQQASQPQAGQQNKPVSIPVMTELPSNSRTASAPAPSTVPRSSTPKTPTLTKLTGSWIYVRPREGQQNKNRSLYPPEFIEIAIQEENGSVKGRYRARYRILDRPISPEVNFDFSGHETNGICECSWQGIGGARGQINLQLTGDHLMKFDWIATNLGTQQGLASGIATLTRRPE